MSCAENFWCLQFRDFLNIAILLATVFAIGWGPIKAVAISRENETKRAKQERQYQIFHALMKTRRLILAPEHVMSLNLVQIEFYGEDKIINAYKQYIEYLELTAPPAPQSTAFYQKRDDRFFELVHEIGKSLGFTLDKRDLEKFSYAPVGWVQDEHDLRVFRKKVIELLNGRGALPVYFFKPVLASKFPPAPNVADSFDITGDMPDADHS